MPEYIAADRSRAQRSAVTSEIRIGLAMSGAIALVLYEAGVTHEVFRLAKSWEAHLSGREIPSSLTQSGSEGYFECLNRIPMRPVVDILTGASAGAVNSTLLASCLAGGTDFVRYHDILLTKLDVAALKFKKTDTPNSLMDSRILLSVLQNELSRNVEAGRECPPGRGVDLCVRLCRTHLAGHCETTRDAIGHQIDVETRSDVIEFSGQDFLDPMKVPQIARATLASAAFPGAFGPVYDPDDRVWYVDGGLWDNQPVDWAVNAVKDKPAFLRTHRCILFVEPNPASRASDRANPVGETEPALSDILMAVPFMGIKGNVWPAISDLFDFNRRSRIFQRLVQQQGLHSLSRQLGGQWLRESTQQTEAAAIYLSALGDGTWRDQEPVSPTVLNQVRMESVFLDNDPALIQRWHAINEAWNALHLRMDPQVDTPIFDRQGGASASDAPATPVCLAALAALRTVGWSDLRQRAVRRRIDMVNASIAGAPPYYRGGGVGKRTALRKYALYLQLERLNGYLYTSVDPAHLPSEYPPEGPRDASTTDWPAYHSRLTRFHSRFRTATAQMLNNLEFAFRYLFRVPAESTSAEEQQRAIERVLADPMRNPIRVLIAWIEAIAAEAARGRVESDPQIDTGTPVENTIRSAQVTTLLEYVQPLGVEAGDAELEPVIRWAAQTRFTKIDAVRHVLGAVSDLTGKRPVDLVRVSPNDTNNLYLITSEQPVDETPARRKLAGEGLGHLQGFLEERWRRNDYVWGRLDACEILLRTVRLYAEREGASWPERDYEDALYHAQNAILRQEADLYAERLRQLGRRPSTGMAPVEAIHRSEPLEVRKGGII